MSESKPLPLHSAPHTFAGVAQVGADYAARNDDELGLSEPEAARRLLANGYNELASAQPRNLLEIIWDVVREPMLLLLLACGAVYLAL